MGIKAQARSLAGAKSRPKQAMLAVTIGALGVAAFTVPLPGAAAAPAVASSEHLVVYRTGVSRDAAHAAIRAAGGTVVEEIGAVGVATVRTTDPEFVEKASGQAAIFGTTEASSVIGQGEQRKRLFGGDVAQDASTGTATIRRAKPAGDDPLAPAQWGNRLIGATAAGSYAHERGSRAVRVAVIDTGVDASHPDLAPVLNRRLSRNFTIDNEAGIDDGPCEVPSCVDPPDVDPFGHGTHVAGTIAAALNGIGTAGVAPGVDLISLRAGQDSGYFLLRPFLLAMVYAALNGVDVVNLSIYLDPWLRNCRTNPADSPAEQAEQRARIEAVLRVTQFARSQGVSMVAATGNEWVDLGKPHADGSSPNFPAGAARDRQIDPNDCLTLPSDAPGVLDVSAVGPPNEDGEFRKAYYSNWGEPVVVAAPGGDSREFFGKPGYNRPENRILAPYPLAVARECGEVDAEGVPNGLTTCGPVPGSQPRTTPLVRDCAPSASGACGLYAYAQGTSMASPYAAGVMAIIVAQRGHRDRLHGGVTMNPDQVERLLRETATPVACPDSNPYVYPHAPEVYDAVCEATTHGNGFFGAGLVSADRASTL
ncbi:S8 family serine peptidase [Micromonospora sp. CPCC 206061]|uniref:S8 family serine peptidase n=1 Tax=Micromonospora sp. CPCC 206061 TaxID=3122410 RepID=UPI002FF43704